jgi:large subunit ribosomal protein L18
MNAKTLKRFQQKRRQQRGRRKLFGTADRPRLAVYRSLKNISAQIIDDTSGKTLVAASSLSKAAAGEMKYGGNCAAATVVGRLLAERARMQGIKQVCFDRGGRRYHGRVKALAESARKSGLEF